MRMDAISYAHSLSLACSGLSYSFSPLYDLRPFHFFSHSHHAFGLLLLSLDLFVVDLFLTVVYGVLGNGAYTVNCSCPRFETIVD